VPFGVFWFERELERAAVVTDRRAGAEVDLAGHAIAPRSGLDAADAAAAAAADGLVGGLSMIPPSERESRWCDSLDVVDVCDVIDCSLELPSLADAVSTCTPDCDSCDIPSCDGVLDCS